MAEPMTFEKVNAETDCNCLEDSVIDENTSDAFIRLVKGRKVKLGHFDSLWDQAKRPSDLNDCKVVCKYKGVSIDKTDSGNQHALRDHYRSLTAVKPALGDHLLKFRCRPSAGKVWHTPTRKSVWHHTFFKSDAFSISLIEVLSVESLK